MSSALLLAAFGLSTALLSATMISDHGTLADAMSQAAFLPGPADGIALIDARPGMAGGLAYRQPDDRVGVTVSRRLTGRFRPVEQR